MQGKRLEEKIKELSLDGKLSCQDALQVAKELDCEPGEVGRVCDELKIKIFNCSLGCF